MSDDKPIQINPRLPAGNVTPPTAPSPEDSGSQALSEALQSSFFLVKVVMLLMVGAFFFSGFFTVKSGQQAIKLRFGKPVGEGENALLGPGAHWAFPAPIDEVKIVSLGKRQEASSTIGMPMSPNTGQIEETPTQVRESLNPAADGYTLTADANIIHTRATISYRVTDPVRYLFAFTNAAEFVTNALDNALLYASSQFKVDDALNKRAAFNECVERRARELIDQEELGVVVEQVMATTFAPAKLKDKFKAVTSASDFSSQTNNQALSYKTDKLAKAAAEAHSRTNLAKAESEAYVGLVKAEVKQFCDIRQKFEADPDLYFQQRQAEVIGRVLANVSQKIYLSRRADGKRELRLQLNREPEAPPPPPSE